MNGATPRIDLVYNRETDWWVEARFHKAPTTTRTLAQPTFNVGDIEQTPIPLPPLTEHERIVSRVTELLALRDALEAKLTQVESANTQLLSTAVHQLLEDSD